MSKTITKSRNIASFQDIKEDKSETEDDEYIKLMMVEIDELNNRLNEERINNDKNVDYIQVLEQELSDTYEKYKKLKDDIKYLEDFKEISKMTSDKIKKTIKEKISKSKQDTYEILNINDLRKISKEKLNTLKAKYNIDK